MRIIPPRRRETLRGQALMWDGAASEVRRIVATVTRVFMRVLAHPHPWWGQ